MSEDGEHAKPANIVAAISERVLESETYSNLFIIFLIILFALPLLGIGIMTTKGIAPAQVANVQVLE